jgi:hypothetical protein
MYTVSRLWSLLTTQYAATFSKTDLCVRAYRATNLHLRGAATIYVFSLQRHFEDDAAVLPRIFFSKFITIADLRTCDRTLRVTLLDNDRLSSMVHRVIPGNHQRRYSQATT